MLFVGLLIGVMLSGVAHYYYMKRFKDMLKSEAYSRRGIMVVRTSYGDIECDVRLVDRMSSGKVRVEVLEIRTDSVSINNDKKRFLKGIPTVVEEKKIDWIELGDRKAIIDEILKDLK